MDLSLQELEAASLELEALFTSSDSEKLPDLSTETLLERHTTLKVERLAMPDTDPPQERAAMTNKVKRIEAELRTRGVDFEPLPQANQPRAIADMSDADLIAEYRQIGVDYPSATAGKKSSFTTRLKNIRVEINKRLEARSQSVEPASDDTEVDIEATEPSDEELAQAEVASPEVTEEASEEVTEEPEVATATKTRTRRRRS